MTAHRTERITEAIREELDELIGYELTDPRIGSIAVTDVQISPDKRHAFVQVRVIDGSDAKQALIALEHARNFLRRELASRLELFRIPELHFQNDAATQIGPRTEHLLRRVKKGRPRE